MLDEKDITQAVEKKRLVENISRSELRECRGKNCIHRICSSLHIRRERLVRSEGDARVLRSSFAG